MKKVIYFLTFSIPLFISGQQVTPDYTKNHTHRIVYKKGYQSQYVTNATNDEKIETINYYDPLGRSVQNVAVKQGGKDDQGNDTDIITHIEYDLLGRQTKAYLPFAKTGTNGDFEDNALSGTLNFYNTAKYENTLNPYTEKMFDGSPLNRVKMLAAQGEDWKMGNGNEVEIDYDTNGVNEVKYYKISLGYMYAQPTLIDEGTFYLENTLYKMITRDEDHTGATKNHTVEEFKDKLGRVVLTRKYADMDLNDDGDTSDAGESEVPHDTYYIYDFFGNLTYVLPPKAEATITTPDTNTLNELCYQYRYDIKNRLIEKKIPGKDWEYIVYNLLDRPVLMQDGNGRVKSPDEWIFTKYDMFDRVAYTGRKAIDKTRSSYQEDYADDPTKYDQFETRQSNYQNLGGVNVYYTNEAIPTGVDEIYTIYYYDDYAFDLPSGMSSTITTSYGISSTSNVKGLATGSKIKVLGTSSWITTITYYDDHKRPIYVYSKNDYLGTTDIIENKLDFTGQVLETKITHKKTGEEDLVTIDKFDFAHSGRLTKQRKDLSQIHHTDLVGVAVASDGTITKTGSVYYWDAGGSSLNKFNKDGFIEWEVKGTNRYLVGFSDTNTNENYNTIDYGIYVSNSKYAAVYENGLSKGTILSSYKDGDILRIERKLGTVYYYANGELKYTSATTSITPMVLDYSIHDVGNQIQPILFGSSETIAINEYDELGQLERKKIGGTTNDELQVVDYAYNIRGWLKGINDVNNLGSHDLFAFKINYNNPTDPTKELFNGNISQAQWRTANVDSSLKSYLYDYDALSRITQAEFKNINNSSEDDKYNLRLVEYDKNGNIKKLRRSGYTDDLVYSEWLDQLTYTYDNGNKLTDILEQGHHHAGFADKTNTQAGDYTYDINGNLLTDVNKGITNIEYNHLNLPTLINFGSTDKIEYFYDALGAKLKKQVTEGGSVTTTDYAGNYIYKDNQLQFFGQVEGYVQPDQSGNFDYVYQYKDHLGNIRLSYSDSNNDGEVTGESSSLFFDDMENSSGWDSVGALGGSSAPVDDEHVLSGNNAIKLEKVAVGDIYAHSNVWIPINNTEGTDYIFSGWVYLESTDYAWANILLFMNEDTESGYFTEVAHSDRVYTKDQWVYIEKQVTVPANIDKINLRVGIYHNSPGATAWFDNLSIRKVNSVNEIVEENNYYPYGLKHNGYNNSVLSEHSYKYNGKELNKELGLEWYDYGVRNYDPALGRWFVSDAFAEKVPEMTPYRYAFNNPISVIDPDGNMESEIADLGGSDDGIWDTPENISNEGTDREVGGFSVLTGDVSIGFDAFGNIVVSGTGDNNSGKKQTNSNSGRKNYKKFFGDASKRVNKLLEEVSNQESSSVSDGDPPFNDISDPIKYPEVKIYESDYILDRTAVSIPGVGIFIHPSYKGIGRIKVLQHEYGHYLDAKYNIGLTYNSVGYTNFYLMVGIPSLITSTGLFGEHKSYSYEIRANKWAKWFFGNNYITDETNYPTH